MVIHGMVGVIGGICKSGCPGERLFVGSVSMVDMGYLGFLERELKKAAEVAHGMFGKVGHTVKAGDNNQVLTEADLKVGKMLVAAVQRDFPEHNIIDEEAGVVDRGSRYTWVIDPIDGTSNFAAGVPTWEIMIGLLDGAAPVAGGLELPEFHEIYLAEKGKGATCNGVPIHVSAEPKLSNVLVRYSWDGHQDDPERTMVEMEDLARITDAVRNVRTSGGPLDDAYTACGRYGASLSRTEKIWDCVAPHILIEEAGGRCTAFDGSPMDYSNPLTRVGQNFDHCAASLVLHRQLQAIIHSSPNAGAA
jgi:myo-inositol-1(or 4)-monophosphatase